MSEKHKPSGMKYPLPPGVTSALDALNKLSDKELTAVATEQGLSLEHYRRNLEKQASQERVSSLVSKTTSEASTTLTREETRMFGTILAQTRMRDMLQEGELPPEAIETLEQQAYRAAEEYYKAQGPQKGGLSQRAENAFIKAITATTVATVKQSMADGTPIVDALAHATASLRAQQIHENNRFRANALCEVLRLIEQRIHLNPRLLQIKELTQACATDSPLTDEQTKLAKVILDMCKAAYLKGRLTHEAVHKAGFMGMHGEMTLLLEIYKSYREHGPFKRTADGTSGAAEFAAGIGGAKGVYAKAPRPRRDPSGGNGEKF
jgi:hypothetical protein